MRFRRLTTVFVTTCVMVVPSACNVFVNVARCDTDSDCNDGWICDSRINFCVRKGEVGDGAADASPDVVEEPPPDVIEEPPPDVIEEPPPDAGPPPCDSTAPFGTPSLVPGLDPGLTSARLSADEREVFYSAYQACAAETCADLYFATRSSADGTFGSSGPLPVVNVPNAADYWPTVSADGALIVFESARSLQPLPDGGYTQDKSRVWASTRTSTQVDFPPAQVQSFSEGDPGVSIGDGAPYLLPTGASLYFLSGDRGGQGSEDLFVVTRVTNVGYPASNVRSLGTGVNTVAAESAPVVSANDLVLYFARENGVPGPRRIWKSSRARATDDFGVAEPIAELNSTDPGTEEYPSWISPDDCRLYFVSTRGLPDGGPSASRLWVATRR